MDKTAHIFIAPHSSSMTVVDGPKMATATPEKQRTNNRPRRTERYNKPLPLQVYPLPAFIPHNPLSYLRIALALLSHSIWTPPLQTGNHRAYFSAETQSIHVTDEETIQAFWEQGFWGSGSLSR